MKKYKIINMGCDDDTTTIIELTNEELEIIKKFVKLNNKNSEYGCQPKIDILDYETKEYIVDCYAKDENER